MTQESIQNTAVLNLAAQVTNLENYAMIYVAEALLKIPGSTPENGQAIFQAAMNFWAFQTLVEHVRTLLPLALSPGQQNIMNTIETKAETVGKQLADVLAATETESQTVGHMINDYVNQIIAGLP